MGKIYLKITNMEDTIKHSLYQINEKIENLKTQLKPSEHAYPYQGIKDAINTTERKLEYSVEKMKEDISKLEYSAEKMKEDISISFGKNIKLMEHACSAIILVLDPLKQATDNLRR